jgi:hypothetical protein
MYRLCLLEVTAPKLNGKFSVRLTLKGINKKPFAFASIKILLQSYCR